MDDWRKILRGYAQPERNRRSTDQPNRTCRALGNYYSLIRPRPRGWVANHLPLTLSLGLLNLKHPKYNAYLSWLPTRACLSVTTQIRILTRSHYSVPTFALLHYLCLLDLPTYACLNTLPICAPPSDEDLGRKKASLHKQHQAGHPNTLLSHTPLVWTAHPERTNIDNTCFARTANPFLAWGPHTWVRTKPPTLGPHSIAPNYLVPFPPKNLIDNPCLASIER